jgi:hypothetical protein
MGNCSACMPGKPTACETCGGFGEWGTRQEFRRPGAMQPSQVLKTRWCSKCAKASHPDAVRTRQRQLCSTMGSDML